MYGNGMNMSGATLPPGFRFHPTDEELIIHYLKQKVLPSSNPIISIISDVNIYQFNPWELPDKASFGENEWFFFSPRDRKYPNGTRPNRAAASGYWKATGTDKPIITSVGSQCLGMKKALVFYKRRPPKGVKTDWMMIEYRLLDDYSPSAQRPKGSMRLDDWVLCRVRQKSKPPPNHQQTGEISLDRSCSYSGCGYLQGQEMVTVLMNTTTTTTDDVLDLQQHNNNNINKHDDLLRQYQQFQGVDEKEQMMMEFQEGSPGCSSSVSNSQTTVDSDNYVKDMLKSMERVLSIGALDELLLASEPDERLKASTSEDSGAAHASVFQISSPAPPSPSYSYHPQQQHFSEL